MLQEDTSQTCPPQNQSSNWNGQVTAAALATWLWPAKISAWVLVWPRSTPQGSPSNNIFKEYINTRQVHQYPTGISILYSISRQVCRYSTSSSILERFNTRRCINTRQVYPHSTDNRYSRDRYFNTRQIS